MGYSLRCKRLARRTSSALTLFASFATIACGSSSIPRPPFAPQPTSALIVVPHEPPPGRVERAPARPAIAGAVWIDGEWAFVAKKWWWTPGRWLVPPAGAKYSPWCTVRAPDGALYFAPAVWRDAKGAEVAGPKGLASATVESGVVVDAEGDMERTMVGPTK